MGNATVGLDRRSPVLSIECIERGNKVTRHVTQSIIDIERLRFLWEKLSPFKILFNDYVKGDLKAFVEHFITTGADGEIYPAGIMYDVDDIGIFFMNEIRPGDSASVHFVFWDRIYKGRETLCREMARYVMDKFELHRLNVEWPIHASLSIIFMENIGFVQEGRKREALLSEGKWRDTLQFGLLKEDLDKEVLPGNWKNKRRVCFDCGQTYRESDKEA